MKPSLQIGAQLQLTMTPQLQQAIRLLQLSTLDLRAEIQQAVENNPLLEVEEEPLDEAWESPPSEASPSFEHYASAPKTLRQVLWEQAVLLPLGPEEQVIALAIVDAIDDRGYLSLPLEEIGEGLSADMESCRRVLGLIQGLHPPGVGARDLRECLLIQLRQLPPETPWREPAMAIVDQHLEALGARQYEKLMQALSLDEVGLKGAIRLIRTLDPHPGDRVGDVTVPWVIPDVIVEKRRGLWRVSLNPEAVPRVRLHPDYSRLEVGDEDQRYIRARLQEAKWFLKSLQSRHQTLLRVAQCIVERQRGFLEHGEEAMEPLVLQDVAAALGIHESTVSRITTQKYAATPKGVYELKYFFSNAVGGGEKPFSATALRAFIRRLIAEEDPRKPLSDLQIASLLSRQGITIARRTVAKYRELLKIPPAKERRSLP